MILDVFTMVLLRIGDVTLCQLENSYEHIEGFMILQNVGNYLLVNKATTTQLHIFLTCINK